MADIGLSPERTSLAWKRTSLSIAAGACIIARLRIEEHLVSSLILCGTALALSGWVFTVGQLRPAARHDGRTSAALAAAVAVLALQEMIIFTFGD